MSTTNKSVYNLNNLSSGAFTFVLNRFPNTTFFIQDVVLPGVDINPKKMFSPVGSFYKPGDKLDYQPLQVNMIVDESLNNWREVYNWSRQLAPTHVGEQSQSVSQYTQIKEEGLTTTGVLTLLTNNLNVNVKATFYDIFPISLGSLNFSTTDTDNKIIKCSASFAYTYYDIEVNPQTNQDGYVVNNIIV